MIIYSGMVGRLLPPSAVKGFRTAVYHQQSPDLVSRSLAAELLADQEQPFALEQILSRVHQVQDISRYIYNLLLILLALDLCFFQFI